MPQRVVGFVKSFVYFKCMKIKISKSIFNVGAKPFVQITILLCMATSCINHSNTYTPQQLSTAADSAKAMTAAISKDITTQGPLAWLKYFEDTNTFFMASRGQLAFTDYDSAKNFIQNILVKNIKAINLQWSNQRIDALSPELVSIAANFHEDITDFSGKLLSMDGYFTAIGKQTAKGWKLHNAHWSIASMK
jgi:hypothetical protein